jgi:putative tricarboxylic transport membrane protein
MSMLNVSRRQIVLSAINAAAIAAVAAPAIAQSTKTKVPAPANKAKAEKIAAKLRIVIPANTGGGWDQTGRALGTALVGAGVTSEVEYENKGGKGGTVGLAYYAEKYSSDPNTLLMGGMVMVGAVALQKPAIDMSRIAPIARLTSDYLVVVVAADSPIRTVKDLAGRIAENTKEVPIAGGSAGGVDHVFAGVFVRGSRGKLEDLVYLPFPGGNEVVGAVLGGKAVAGVSGYSEFSEQLATGKLRAIGVSSKRAAFGIPAIREQGVDVDMANWRGVFTGVNVPTTRQAELAEGVKTATISDSWQKTLKQNRWESSVLSGPAFNSFIDFDLTTSRVMMHLLKLKA